MKYQGYVTTEIEITQDSEGNFVSWVVEYFDGDKPTKRFTLPQVFPTYEQAHDYAYGWLAL